MLESKPENTLVLLENPEIYDGWSAALTQSGDFVNRWDPITESANYEATQALIQQFIEAYEPKGFEGEW